MKTIHIIFVIIHSKNYYTTDLCMTIFRANQDLLLLVEPLVQWQMLLEVLVVSRFERK